MYTKGGPKDDLGWVLGGIFKCLFYSIPGIIKCIIHPVKMILNSIIIIILGFIIYLRVKYHCSVNWIDVGLLVGFFKMAGYSGEKWSLIN